MQLDRATVSGRLPLIVAAWAGASFFFTAVLMIGELGGHKPLGFALYANAVNFGLWTVILPIIWKSTASFPITGQKKVWNGVVLLLIVTVLATFVACTHWAIVYWTYFPYRSLFPTFRVLLRSELIRFMPVDTLIGVVMAVAFTAWRAWQALQVQRARANDLERQLAVARLEALRMQLHPHFLFNTLHAVAGLTVEDPSTARRMVIALGDLLRRTLKGSSTEEMRPLAEELEYSDLYLGIEKLRLGERLLLNYEIDPAASRAFVPQFLLQPLFENAIRHGAARIAGPCEISFRASCTPDALDILIRNDGPKPEPLCPLPRFGVGLTNTTDRLRIHYGSGYTFRFSARPEGGAQIEMSIPYRVCQPAFS
jgi:hypothetical protein